MKLKNYEEDILSNNGVVQHIRSGDSPVMKIQSTFTLDEQPDEMHIVASTDKLVLDKGKEDETAITFTWDAASSPVNETDLVTYSLRLYATANKSANNTDFL